jgi:hypothetical protein
LDGHPFKAGKRGMNGADGRKRNLHVNPPV